MSGPTSAERPDPTEAAARIEGLCDKAYEGKLTLYLGAGVSKGSPTELPLSDELLEAVLDPAKLKFRSALQDGDPTTLEGLADAVGEEEPDKESLHKLLLDAAGFDCEPANDAHAAIVLLLREGLVTTISANWDTCIERKGHQIEARLPKPTVSDKDRRRNPWKGGLHKVHGCALEPSSLVVSSSNLARPSDWVSDAVGAEIGYQVLAFVGIGTVADYVGNRVSAVLDEMGDDHEQAFVVEPEDALGESWTEILGTAAEDRHIPCDAAEFFERLLSGLLVLILSKVSLEANNLEPPATSVQEALATFCANLREQESDAVIRWWTDGTDSALRLNGALKTARAHQQVLAVATLLRDDSPELKAVDEALTVELPDCYVELASVDGGKGETLKRRQTARLQVRERRGAFPKLGKPVLVLHEGSTSPVEPDRPRDVLAEGQTEDLVEGADQDRFRFLPVQTVLESRPNRTELLAS